MSGGWMAEGEPAGLPPLIERPDIPVRVRRTLTAWLVIWTVRPAWLWRRELLVLAVLGGLAGWGWSLGGTFGAVGFVAALVPVTAAGWPWLGWWLTRARWRRRWDRACRFARLATSNDRVPRIRKIRRVPVGLRLRVRVPRGLIVDGVESAAAHLASDLRVREVRVRRDADRAHLAVVDLVQRDPLAVSDPLMWPWLDRPSARLWEGVPVGLSEDGEPVTARLPGFNLLLGGEPGAGKSAALSTVLAGAALDPWTKVVGLDAKRLELAFWRPCMAEVVYADIGEACELLEWLIGEMDQRYRALESAGLRKVPDGAGLLLLVVDELRFYTAHPDKQEAARFTMLLIDLVARGRAAGMPVSAATQKPSHDVVSTSLRDLFAYRWAMRSTTRAASDTILGQGWASLGYSAASIPISTRGVGLLLAEESAEPVRLLSYYLTDEEIRRVAARGAELRRVHGTG
ncbi:hypothetical protein LO762_10680 [Actinocorallia sp. API 0066]|uniref:FtsK/SpoIIIE domain-containing protein n=1 Tax=Actinocorallia sp. API 0066 TaxID=2896846 RepID=UPI001E457DAB|nr:FtsK/SpoIIIE domain-containing protein [Actinocorallia sp. API 0066]MCD0449650.1 hypothetical protein [Actinocorallia sp. API 0066]